MSVCNDEDGVMCKEVMNIKHTEVQTNSIEYHVACRLVDVCVCVSVSVHVCIFLKLLNHRQSARKTKSCLSHLEL